MPTLAVSRRPQGWDDGAEIMIWLGSNGIGGPAFSRIVTIDGIQWGYMLRGKGLAVRRFSDRLETG